MKFTIADRTVYIQRYEYPFIDIKIDKRTFKIKIIKVNKDTIEYLYKNKKVKFYWTQIEDDLFQTVSEGDSFICKVKYVLPSKSQDDVYQRNIPYEIKAPVSGLITKIFIEQDATVHRGQKLLSLNAMKMENEVQSPIEGKVAQIKVTENKEVNKNDTLIIIHPTI